MLTGAWVSATPSIPASHSCCAGSWELAAPTVAASPALPGHLLGVGSKAAGPWRAAAGAGCSQPPFTQSGVNRGHRTKLMAQSDEQSKPDVPLPPAVTGWFPSLGLGSHMCDKVTVFALNVIGSRARAQPGPSPTPSRSVPLLGLSHRQDHPLDCPPG